MAWGWLTGLFGSGGGAAPTGTAAAGTTTRTRYFGRLFSWSDLWTDIQDGFRRSGTSSLRPPAGVGGRMSPFLKALAALGVVGALVSSVGDASVTAHHVHEDHAGQKHANGWWAGIKDAAKGFFVKSLGFLAGGSLFAALGHGIARRFGWGYGASLLAKALGLGAGGWLGAWYASHHFPNKAAQIAQHQQEKDHRSEVFDSMRDKKLGGTVPLITASKLGTMDATTQDAYFEGMAKQTLTAAIGEKPYHAFLGIQTPFACDTEAFKGVSYSSPCDKDQGHAVTDEALAPTSETSAAHH